MKYFLVDNVNLRVLKVSPNIVALRYWAELLIPENDFLIALLEAKAFSTFTRYELCSLHHSLTGLMPLDTTTYRNIIRSIIVEVEKVEVDYTTIDELKEQLGIDLNIETVDIEEDDDSNQPLTVPPAFEKTTDEPSSETDKALDAAAQDEAVPPAETKPVTEVKWPREGTSARRIWEVAESLCEDDAGTIPKPKQVAEILAAEGIKKGTVQAQYSRWKKMTGRK